MISNTSKKSDVIRIRGARVHNLQAIDVDLPHGKLIVVTGPSGSGKSSLVFDTIFAEGRRQFLETLSVRARQLLHQLDRPDVDLIDGLQPTICIDQFPSARNPRSTVATVTEIHDYLRILFARLGSPYCIHCRTQIQRHSAEEIQTALMELGEGTRVMLLAPCVQSEAGDHRQLLASLRKRGFLRVRIDGTIMELDDHPSVDPDQVHSIDLVVDRIILRPGIEKRFAESIRLAADNPLAQVVADVKKDGEERWQELRFATQFSCAQCGFSFEDIQPRHFSYGSPYGACETCQGLGTLEEFSEALIWSDPQLSLSEQAIAELTPNCTRQSLQFLEKLKTDPKTPVAEWPAATRRKVLSGCGRPRFLGMQTLLNQQYATTTDRKQLEALSAFRDQLMCAACQGARLGEVGRSVRIRQSTFGEICRMTITQALAWFESLTFSDEQQKVAWPLLQPILERLQFLEQVGVPYLTLDRSADSLSGGELQRIRLATGIGASLAGVCYVLDEPSIGLHPRDHARLTEALKRLQRLGNTVVVVEHDLDMIRAADYVIDMGPSAGPAGGHIVAQGSVSELSTDLESPTGKYLGALAAVPFPLNRRPFVETRCLKLKGVHAHNLQDVDVEIPLGMFVCVTGVSGSGKSSLINHALAPAIRAALKNRSTNLGPLVSLTGAEHISQIVTVDQMPIGRSGRSNPATYTGLFDDIRAVFAKTREARRRGFTAKRFSFNVKSGRCDACQGYGVKRIEMGMLADLTVPCDRCGGSRFNPQTLQIRYRHKTIADVLDMTVAESVEFFASIEKILQPLQCMAEVGLGYLKLGQPADTLSGGEAQRVKLATQLSRRGQGHVLYLLDEPTTGLHISDIERLLSTLQQLIELDNTVVVIEHQLDVIKTADWVIDLGPEGGEHGGHVLVAGPPEDVAAHARSLTGQFLAPYFTDSS